ncbi:MAG TPA: hypothetical protein ENK06_06630, partial [Gammaproteobacteria bacterium]|nr:hypothetical protein [Gammaproteobacteria bacterium]
MIKKTSLKGFNVKKLTKGQLLLTTLLSGVAFGFGAVNTIAQEAPVETVDAPAQVAEVDNSNDVVIVTGSRIRRRGIETIFPTTTVDETNLTDRGFTNIADALTEIPAFGNGFSDAGSAQGASPGQNFVDFLDLGTSRTLVLVDGKRFVNSATPVLGGASGLQVDFNIIPSALIDRTDVIGVGGAAIYGADAIAGTVNVILKDDFEGLEASSQYKVPEAGGAEKFQFQLVAGANFAEDKGNVTFSAQYETQEGMLQTARDSIYAPENNYTFFRLLREDDNGGEQRLITNNLLINIFTNGGLASGPFPDLFGFGTDFGTVIPSFGIGQFPNGGFLQFDANGELVTFNPGTSIPGVSIFFAQGGDGSNLFQETRSIQTPSERLVGTSRFNYEFNDHLKAKADFIFGNTKSTDQANQGGFASFAFSPTTDGALEFSIDHPLLTGQARQALLDSGIQPGGTFTLSRLMNDIVDSSNSVETSLWRFSGGLEGDFSIGERQFFWDVNFTHGETDLEQIATVINDGAFLNALNVTRVTQA